jgi:hypothetical protein
MKHAVAHNMIDFRGVAHASHSQLIHGAYDSFVDAQIQVRIASHTRKARLARIGLKRRCGPPARHTSRPLKEYIMIAAFFEKLGSLFSPSHYDEREAYLASSYDLEDLERRMRHFDNGGYPFRLHSSVMPRDNEL